MNKYFFINFYSIFCYNYFFQQNMVTTVINTPYNLYINIFLFIFLTQYNRFLQGTKYNHDNLVSFYTYDLSKLSFFYILINILVSIYDFSDNTYFMYLIQYYICFYLDKGEFTGYYRVKDNSYIRKFLFSFFNNNNYDLVVKNNTINNIENCILCLHPHGFIPINTAVNLFFLPKRKLIFDQYFSNLSERLYLGGASFNFFFPILRELYLLSGSIDCSQPNLKKYLKHYNSIAIFLGGAREAQYSGLGSTKIIIKNRTGIFKLALETGKPIIPIFTFGENDLFTSLQISDNVFMNLFHRLSGLWFCFIYYNIFNKQKIITVIGEPIYTEKKIIYTYQDIENLQSLYKNNLSNLFDHYKSNFYNYSQKNLEFI